VIERRGIKTLHRCHVSAHSGCGLKSSNFWLLARSVIMLWVWSENQGHRAEYDRPTALPLGIRMRQLSGDTKNRDFAESGNETHTLGLMPEHQVNSGTALPLVWRNIDTATLMTSQAFALSAIGRSSTSVKICCGAQYPTWG
jgi:hypothetical protein